MTNTPARQHRDIADDGSFRPRLEPRGTNDPLSFPGYRDAVERAARSGEADESVVAGPATLGGHDVELALFQFGFLGGSIGEIAGERLALGIDAAARRRVPFVLRAASGGARMQEGMRALVQMPKVAAARLSLADRHVPFIAVLAHPTTGGVLAGMASLADFTAAESGATVGFGGPRVVETLTGRALGEGSHTPASALAHGLIDAVIEPAATHDWVRAILETVKPDERDPALEPEMAEDGAAPDAWTAVQAARSPRRLAARELLRRASQRVIPLRGDRAGLDDPALYAAVARIAGRRAVVLAPEHGTLLGPAAFRKARRAVAVAARLALPVVALVDTPGADPSPESENGGIAWEVGALFEAMLQVPVPVLSIVVGEGGSGGALAFAVADTLLVYDDAFFAVIGPEAAAQIIWRDPGRAPEAAAAMRLTASDLCRLGIADGLLAGPASAGGLRDAIAYHLDRLAEVAEAGPHWPRSRIERWRNR